MFEQPRTSLVRHGTSEVPGFPCPPAVPSTWLVNKTTVFPYRSIEGPQAWTVWSARGGAGRAAVQSPKRARLLISNRKNQHESTPPNHPLCRPLIRYRTP